MKANFEKTTTLLKKVLSEEKLKDLERFLEKHKDSIIKGVNKTSDFLEKHGDKITENINNASEFVKKHTDTLCEVINIEKLDMDILKDILRETMSPKSHYVAALDLGRNKKDQLEIFLQHLDVEKKAIDINKVYCIRCDMKSEEIKKAFGNKNMLLINL